MQQYESRVEDQNTASLNAEQEKTSSQVAMNNHSVLLSSTSQQRGTEQNAGWLKSSPQNQNMARTIPHAVDEEGGEGFTPVVSSEAIQEIEA